MNRLVSRDLESVARWSRVVLCWLSCWLSIVDYMESYSQTLPSNRRVLLISICDLNCPHGSFSCLVKPVPSPFQPLLITLALMMNAGVKVPRSGPSLSLTARMVPLYLEKRTFLRFILCNRVCRRSAIHHVTCCERCLSLLKCFLTLWLNVTLFHTSFCE